MTERIDKLVYETPTSPATVEGEETTLYLTGPAEYLCKRIAASLAADEVWRALFGESIDAYKRMDYPIRALPALRIYNNSYRKDAETWYITGQITIDMIFPASLRRRDTEQIPDTVAAALLQQFRRPSWFAELCAVVPGLNELGKTFAVDKALAFEWEDDLVPLTQLLANFRLNLNAWDDYLTSDNRTKDDPFLRTLGDLRRIVGDIAALRDDDSDEVDVGVDLSTTDTNND